MATIYSNRCASYLALGEEQKALADAEACAKEAPDWPKAHFRLGKVHMQKRSWLKAYSAFKRGWHLDTSNEELTRACQEAHKAMTGLDKVEQQLQNSNTKKPMSQEELGKLRFEHFKAKQVERFEAKKASESNKVFCASDAAPVANPSYREEALKRTAMMAAGKTDTTEANAAVDDDDAAASERLRATLPWSPTLLQMPPLLWMSLTRAAEGSASTKPRGIDYSKWDHLDEVVVDREAAAKEAEGSR